MNQVPPPVRAPRLAYIDWLRGVAVLIMIVWHSLDAWTVPGDRYGSAWAFIIFLGGWAAPLFLFLAGVSVALAGSSQTARALEAGVAAVAARRAGGWHVQKRGWQIFGLAHLFRVQSFLLNPSASWSSLLKPDILNILGLGVVAAAFCWTRAETRARQAGWLLAPAAAIVLLAPASRAWAWPAVLRDYAPRLEAYIRPINGMGVFSVFPWVAFVLAGTLVGIVISEAHRTGEGHPLQGRLAAAGLAVGAAGAIGIYLPSLTDSQFWTTSLSFFLIRVGAMTTALPLGWLWVRRFGAARSPLVLFGQASLFVYWVHVELAYGLFTLPLHAALRLPWAVGAFLVLTVVMWGAAWAWVRRRRPLVPSYLTVGGPSGAFRQAFAKSSP